LPLHLIHKMRDIISIFATCARLTPVIALVCLSVLPSSAAEIDVRAGDGVVALHWKTAQFPADTLFQVFRASDADGPLILQNAAPSKRAEYLDNSVRNGTGYFYRIKFLHTSTNGWLNGKLFPARPEAFKDDEAFVGFIQRLAFDYFWYESDPVTGLTYDRTRAGSPASIAAVGFGLTGLGVGVERKWISRTDAVERTLRVLRTLWNGPQNNEKTGATGYKGWFYHFLKPNSATRAWKCEVSTIDTVLLLGGVIFAEQFYQEKNPQETEIRNLARSIMDRVDWQWVFTGRKLFGHGWFPETGKIKHFWEGYNEAMILYIFALGQEDSKIPEEAWQSWTRTYKWEKLYGQEFLTFPPLFGHQYSHCWIDFRDLQDSFMREKGSDYFKNSRSAVLAQQSYCVENPGNHAGYGTPLWGISASDGPPVKGRPTYSARGAPPSDNDDGTLMASVVGASMPFAPELCISTLKHLYYRLGKESLNVYGFGSAYNLSKQWWSDEVIGIDQGAMLLMIENYRSGFVWKIMRDHPVVRRGMERAGFRSRTD